MTMLIALATAAATLCPVPPGWIAPMPVHAGLTRSVTFGLKTGTSYRLALAPAPLVRLVTDDRHIPKAGRWAGMAAIDVPARGKLTAILSNATYVDLVRDGVILTSVDHARLEGCPTMHKSVTFDVVPGRYLVQFTDAPERSLTLEAMLG